MVLRFVAERLFETPWRLQRRSVNGQPGLLCHYRLDGVWQPAGVTVLTLRDGQVVGIGSFVDPGVVRRFPGPDR
jgi:RNA polymerase sigma-70 factor (ECF subfamily)